ncbi:hypothetical protein ElyMa_004168500 [Elysia marginata]|uniref:Uncharacterized protein n=1 Tax=Elysia marginata TaxID=1093978 RepID=A0AAV4GJS4_9GAST|nr:hypothetical protein ElyMa_004168500 [Elysia marginata]
MSSLRSSSFGVMRPPKPPCWRDFVVSSAKGLPSTETVDNIQDPSGRPLGARSPVTDLLEPVPGTRPAATCSAPGTRPGRLARRPRARIHRTRSEHVILPEDLPDAGGANPLSGSIAAPDDVGPSLRSRPRALTPDGQLYVEENNKRCQSWLDSIEAAEPLDEVDYNADDDHALDSRDLHLDHSIRQNNDIDFHTDAEISSERRKDLSTGDYLSTGLGQATVEMEIPEETFQWEEDIFPSPGDHTETRPRFIAEGDTTCQACKKSTRVTMTNTTAGSSSNSRKFPAPPLCGRCTDCVSCGSGEPLSSAASDSNIRTGRAKTVEDRSNLCTCIHSPTPPPKLSNKRSNLRKSLSSKSPGISLSTKDRSMSSPAVPRSSGRIPHRGGSVAGTGATVIAETASRPGPWQNVTVRSPGAARRARSVSRRRASQRNLFRDKDIRL